jgi:hypothetical protein
MKGRQARNKRGEGGREVQKCHCAGVMKTECMVVLMIHRCRYFTLMLRFDTFQFGCRLKARTRNGRWVRLAHPFRFSFLSFMLAPTSISTIITRMKELRTNVFFLPSHLPTNFPPHKYSLHLRLSSRPGRPNSFPTFINLNTTGSATVVSNIVYPVRHENGRRNKYHAGIARYQYPESC